MRRLIHVIASLALAAACCASPALAARGPELRNWSDATGKYRIEAKLAGTSGDRVTLELKDGSKVEIELKKLSAADQKYLEDQSANPFKKVIDDNPFKPVDPKDASTDSEPDASAAAAKKVPVDLSKVEVVPLMPTAGEWKVAVPQPVRPPELKSRAIPVPQKSDFWEKLNGFAVSATGQRAVLGYAMDNRRVAGTTRVVLCDLAQGKTLVSASTPGVLAPLALNDHGTQVLMRGAEWGRGNADRLELWNLAPSGITRVVQWFPHGDQNGGQRDIGWGAYLDDERIATLGGTGQLVVWSVGSLEPLFQLQIDGGSRPALSPNRKWLAFHTGKQVGILDLAKKEVIALQSTEHVPWPKLCFSPDASKLGCLSHSKLIVWNVENGEMERDVPLTGLGVSNDTVLWPHERYLILGKNQLFDVENQVVLWNYRGHDGIEPAGNLCAFSVSAGHDKPGAVVLASVPSPAFEAALETAHKQPDFFVLKPGVTVKLNLDGLPDPAERERVREALTKKLEERGFNVGPQGTIDLIATAEAGAERDVSYHGFGIWPWKSYKVREYFSRLAFSYRGQVCWQTQGNNVPGFIQLKEGETIEHVLRRSERPNYAFYGHVELPKMLLKPGSQGGLGASEVTVAGVQ